MLQFQNANLKSDFEDLKKRVQVGDKQLADSPSDGRVRNCCIEGRTL